MLWDFIKCEIRKDAIHHEKTPFAFTAIHFVGAPNWVIFVEYVGIFAQGFGLKSAEEIEWIEKSATI